MLLFCIPHAGGSTLSYIKWKKYLNEGVTFMPLDLPGHITRREQPLCQNFYNALEDLYQCIRSAISDTEEPYAIFGHSLGAVFTYELYYKLDENGDRLPSSLFLSGRWPPYIEKKEDRRYKSFEEFKAGFIDSENLDKLSEENKDLGDYFYQVIYTDLKLLDTYRVNPTPCRINSEMTIMWGSEDTSMSYADVSAWGKAAGRSINFKMITGTHMFPIINTIETVNLINQVLTRY